MAHLDEKMAHLFSIDALLWRIWMKIWRLFEKIIWKHWFHGLGQAVTTQLVSCLRGFQKEGHTPPV